LAILGVQEIANAVVLIDTVTVSLCAMYIEYMACSRACVSLLSTASDINVQCLSVIPRLKIDLLTEVRGMENDQ